MFTVVNHGLQVAHPWETDRLKLCSCGILIILSLQLRAHPTPVWVYMITYVFAMVGAVR